VVNFAKFRGPVRKIPWLTAANCPNFTVYHGLSFMCKLSFILFKKLQFLDAGMALSYASNIQRKLSIFFLFTSAICQLVVLCLFMIVL